MDRGKLKARMEIINRAVRNWRVVPAYITLVQYPKLIISQAAIEFSRETECMLSESFAKI